MTDNNSSTYSKNKNNMIVIVWNMTLLIVQNIAYYIG